MPLLAFDRVSLAFGHLPLLDQASLQIEPRERVSIIGRNGTGKSTLLRIMSGEQPPDDGSVWTAPALRIARLEQDVPLSTNRAVFDVVADGLGSLRDLVTAYHHAVVEVADGTADDAAMERLGRLQHEMDERDGWQLEQRIETVLSHLQLPSDAIVDTLSGGWRRRVLLARALVAAPDLLLLDEPTNHLDITTIGWLEDFLADYPGAIVFVTHDRAFLERLATRIVEVDRGRLTSWPGDYATFLRKKEEWLANEAIRDEKFDKRLAGEEVWLRQGVKARRTRDEGRVRALMAMRAERAERRTRSGTAALTIERGDPSGRLVVEAEHVDKAFGDRPVIRDFSTRILRGDRIGIIGPNGSGKTTLIRLLLGQLAPDAGEIRLGTNVQIAYYDQQREQLDPERTVFDTVGDGNDTVTVGGAPRHVYGYLGDFLFPPDRARSPVKALSGGERNRLLLARLFTRPANLLVLDEPTNDLDLETLEMLEERLVEWSGTLLLVSHDRRFVDHVVTSTLVLEGDGRVEEHVGGYDDWLRWKGNRTAVAAQRVDVASAEPPVRAAAVASVEAPGPAARTKSKPPKGAPKVASKSARGTSPAATGASPEPATRHSGAAAATSPLPQERVKLSNKERRELDGLPKKIAALEEEQGTLNRSVASPEFYREPAGTISETLARLEAISVDLAALYARWDTLDSRAR